LLFPIPWKKSFSVEVNGLAQIHGNMWVSLYMKKVPEKAQGPNPMQGDPGLLLTLYQTHLTTAKTP
jgi:hypothetical protein